MLLPLGDAPRITHARPWANYTLLALNVGVYLWATVVYPGDAAYQQWMVEWGFVPVAPRLETFFTSMFMHAGLDHIGMNMLFLWIFGRNVEGRLGHGGYVLAYLASGLAAVLLFWVLGPASTRPLVGASGAISGVLGFYFLAFPRHRVRIVYWFFLIGMAWVPARIVLGLFFVLDLLHLFAREGQGSGGGVAYAAHVGGFVFGLGIAGVLRAMGPRAEVVRPEAAPGPSEASALLADARRALHAGRATEAQRLLQAVLVRHVHAAEAPEAALQLGLLYARVLGRPEAAREPLVFAARLHPDARARALAQDELGRIT